MITVVLVSKSDNVQEPGCEEHVAYFHNLDCGADQLSWVRNAFAQLCEKLSPAEFTIDVYGTRIQIEAELSHIRQLKRTSEFRFIIRRAVRKKHAAVPKMAGTCT